MISFEEFVSCLLTLCAKHLLSCVVICFLISP